MDRLDRAAGSSSLPLRVSAAARLQLVVPELVGRGRETKKEVYICEDADGNHCIS